MAQSENIIRELKRYKEKLSDLSGRNRELYFKERNSTSINLSKFPFQLNLLHAKDKFIPLRFMNLKNTDLVSLKNFNLDEHFLLEKLSNDEASVKFLKKLEKLKSSDDCHQKEFGISGAWLLGPFLCWQTPFAKGKEDLMISPIFKMAINLEKNKNKKMILKIKEAEFKINPTLMRALKVFNNIGLENCDKCDEILDFFLILQKKFAEKKINIEILNDNFQDIQEKKEIYKKLDKSNFIIFDVAYIDQLQANRMSLFNDYEYITENSSTKIDSQEVLIQRSDLNKNEIYQKFMPHYKARINQANQKEWKVFFGDSDQKKKQLNDYADIIQQQHAELIFNNSEIILENLSINKENYIHEIFHKLRHLSLNQVSKISENVKNIQNIARQSPNCLKSVWLNKQRNIVRNLSLEQELLRIDKRVYLIKCHNEKLSQKFYEITGLDLSNNRNLFNNIFKLDSLSNTFASIWKLKDSKDNFIMELKLLKEKIYSKLNSINLNYNMSKTIKPQSDLSVLNTLILYYSKTKTIIDYFSYKFWKMRKIRNEICVNWDSTNKQFIAYKEYFLAKNEVINLISKITGEKNDKCFDSNEEVVLLCKNIIEYIDKLLGYIQIYTDFKLHNFSNLSLESFSAFNFVVEKFNETIDIVKKFNENMTEIKVIEGDLRKIINIDNTNLDVEELYHTICCLRDELDYLVCLDRIELLIEKTEFESRYLGISDLLKNTLYQTNHDWAELIIDSCLIGWTDHLYSTP